MKGLQTFEKHLAERYEKLYGEKNCKNRVEKEKKHLLLKCIAILTVLCVGMLSGLSESAENQGYLKFNRQGEIV